MRRPPVHHDHTWKQAQTYVDGLFAAEDVALRGALRRIERAGMPPISISASEGKLLQVLARAAGARRILEVGTLGGYSAIWLARALPPGGKLVTLEIDESHAAVARENLRHAGLGKRVDVRVGPALRLMRQMAAGGERPFDLVFLDADKDEYPGYLRLAYHLTRPGGLILADNALGRALGGRPGNGVIRCNAIAARHRGLASVVVPVLGKGSDGLLVCVKLARGQKTR